MSAPLYVAEILNVIPAELRTKYVLPGSIPEGSVAPASGANRKGVPFMNEADVVKYFKAKANVNVDLLNLPQRGDIVYQGDDYDHPHYKSIVNSINLFINKFI